MKLRFLILILLLAVVTPPALSQQPQLPLTKGQVMDLVKFGMSGPEVAEKIKKLGIDFEPTDDYLEVLRNAGAEDAVIQALRIARPKPLTREQVGKLVAGGVPSERAATLVKQHGIDFLPDEEYFRTLKLAGANDPLITALREASARVTAELVVVTSPNAEVSLDGALQGRADAHGELAVRAGPGTHTLKVSLAGKKDFVQPVALAARQATKIEARLETVGPLPGTVRENPKDGLKYVWIPPGTFMMGCSPGDNEYSPVEMPSHHVTITKGFWMGQTEVTVRAYKRFAAATGRQMPDAPNFNRTWANNAMPMVLVSWNDANDYCTWTGGRLPTEAEWEYAARGGSTEARYGPIDEIAWYNNNSGGQAQEVAQKRANGFGLFDVLGNVYEWVNDRSDWDYYRNSPSQDPRGPESGEDRVLRGGSWVENPRDVRLSHRFEGNPGGRSDSYGFRCGGEVFAP